MMATYCVDTQSGEKLPKERLLEMLDFIFQSILPEQGYTLRHEQLALAQDIFTALEKRSVLLSEAGVGIGKTHAYLIAAILVKRSNLNDFWLRGNYPGMAYIAKMPVVIATSSIALQKSNCAGLHPGAFPQPAGARHYHKAPHLCASQGQGALPLRQKAAAFGGRPPRNIQKPC